MYAPTSPNRTVTAKRLSKKYYTRGTFAASYTGTEGSVVNFEKPAA
jgi:hypothetical protein